MLCERCKKREASVHMIKVINGNKTEVSLCEVCAKELTQMPFNMVDIASGGDESQLDNLLGGFFDALGKTKQENNKEEYDVVCKKCGSRLSKFRLGRKVGCPECYESFGVDMEMALGSINENIEYLGKIPQRELENIQNKKRINELKDKLQDAIVKEEYEKAEELKNTINELKNI